MRIEKWGRLGGEEKGETKGEQVIGKDVGRNGGLNVISLKVTMKLAHNNKGIRDIIPVFAGKNKNLLFSFQSCNGI